MKTNYTNKLISAGLLLMILSTGILPVSAHAATNISARNFCKQLPTLKNKVTTKIGLGESKLSAHRSSVEGKLTDSWNTRDQKLADARTQANTNKEDQFTSLFNKASNERERIAITIFKDTINGAVETRRSAVDNAVKTYRDSVQSLFTTREQDIDGYIAILKSEIDSAFVRAQTDCVAQVDPTTIKSTLTGDIRNAQYKFRDSKQSQESYESKVKDLANIRDEAIAKAKTDFENTMAEAKATLKAALPAKK